MTFHFHRTDKIGCRAALNSFAIIFAGLVSTRKKTPATFLCSMNRRSRSERQELHSIISRVSVIGSLSTISQSTAKKLFYSRAPAHDAERYGAHFGIIGGAL